MAEKKAGGIINILSAFLWGSHEYVRNIYFVIFTHTKFPQLLSCASKIKWKCTRIKLCVESVKKVEKYKKRNFRLTKLQLPGNYSRYRLLLVIFQSWLHDKHWCTRTFAPCFYISFNQSFFLFVLPKEHVFDCVLNVSSHGDWSRIGKFIEILHVHNQLRMS